MRSARSDRSRMRAEIRRGEVRARLAARPRALCAKALGAAHVRRRDRCRPAPSFLTFPLTRANDGCSRRPRMGATGRTSATGGSRCSRRRRGVAHERRAATANFTYVRGGFTDWFLRTMQIAALAPRQRCSSSTTRRPPALLRSADAALARSTGAPRVAARRCPPSDPDPYQSRAPPHSRPHLHQRRLARAACARARRGRRHPAG